MRKGPPPTANNVPEIRTMHGLYLQPNTFNVPDGALEVANNVLVKDDETLTSRRGYYEYFDGTGSYNNIFTYENTLLGFYDNKAAYYSNTGSAPNVVGVEHILGGEAFTLTGTTRSFQANSNFYFTSDQGIMKLTSFDSPVTLAGAPPGLDIALLYDPTTTASWFLPGNTVGYRVVFGYIDENSNTILGAPSQIAQINNPQVVGASYSSTGSGPWTVTVTTTSPHGLLTGDTVLISNATDPDADGSFQITVTGAMTFTYVVSSSDPASGTLDFGYGMAILIEMSVPSEVTTALPWFYRVYRSSQNLISVGIFSDFQLVAENMLTPAEIAAGVAYFTDTVDDLLRSTILYTNENSGEGELQANTRPPLAQDVAVFHNFALYANCTTRHLLNLNVIDPTDMVSGDYIEIKVDATIRRYVARTGVGNATVFANASNSAGNLLITYPSHGFVNGDTIYVANIASPGTLPAGTYFVIASTTNDFEISLTSGGSPRPYGGETTLTIEGDTDGTYSIFQLSESSSAAERITETAQGIVKAINRDALALIYAQYTTAIDEVPGKMTFQAKGFTGAISIRANSLAAGEAFSPALPDSFSSGTQVVSKNDQLPNAIFISKLGEPEAVPLINFLPAGSRNFPIYRIVALRDTVIIVKADGVWRMTGDSLTNFIITLLDGTVILVATSSLDVLNNQAIFLSNQGVCLATESSVQIISRAKIENVIQPILGQPNLSSQTSGLGYETERLYLLTTTTPNEETAQVTWCYNILTNEWSSWDTLFTQAEIGPNDTMYYVSFDNRILIERKSQTAIDYSDQNYPIFINTITGTAARITITGNYAPKEGDMVVKDNVITWIEEEPVPIAGPIYDVVFSTVNNLEIGDIEPLYASFDHSIKFSPFHAGLVSKMKVFSQFQVHMRNNAMTKATFSFIGDTVGGSGTIEWESLLTFLGWGFFPWGYEPWGQGSGINTVVGTKPAPIVRTLIPTIQARGTFIQAQIEHRKAAEALNIQAISYVVRPYAERVSR